MRSTMRTLAALACTLVAQATLAQTAIKAETIHTVTAGTIEDGVILIVDGTIDAIGPGAEVTIPDGYEVIEAAVAIPGLIDAHATAGLTGIYNADGQAHDQDMLDRSEPVQPGLRAVDAYNPREPLVEYLRSFGVTTLHTGHAPGELISGQTMIVKSAGDTVGQAVIREVAGLACTLDPASQKGGGKSPGTRGKQVAMLREALIGAQRYQRELEAAEADDGKTAPARDLDTEALVKVLNGELPLIVTANRAQDIASALRLAEEFGFDLWLDMAAEAYLLKDEIKQAGVPVILHPTMFRAYGPTQNLSFTTAAELREAGIPVCIQSGYEGYVPKVRVILFEAAIAAVHGLGFDGALETITIEPARLLGIDDRVGSLEVGKDADIALYDGDPFEYTTHCVGVLIGGELVSDEVK